MQENGETSVGQVQPVPETAVAVRFAGSVSVTVTSEPSVAAVPMLFAVTEKVTELPGVKVPAVCVFETVRSGVPTTVIASVALSFARLVWPPPPTVALFVRVAPTATPAPIVAVTEIAG